MTQSKGSSSHSDMPERASRLRQQLKQLLDELVGECWQIADSDPMIVGSFYQVFKTCTHPGCRCHAGERHGPFPALSWTAEGKRRMVMVRAKDAERVQQAAAAFKRFQQGMTRIRRTSKQIERTLDAIRVLLSEEYR